MRVIEFILYLLVVGVLIAKIIRVKSETKWTMYMSILSIVLLLVHAVIEGIRWQMLFAYIYIVIWLITSIRKLILTKSDVIKRPILARVLRIICLIILLISIVIPISFPVFDLPETQGPYHVGVRDMYFSDENREEILTENREDTRAFMVSIWYPTSLEDGELKTYFEKDEIDNHVYKDYFLKGNFWYRSMALINTNSQLNAPISEKEDKYPVLIYSHSYGGSSVENTMLFEELASHGYIVFSISHSYESIGSMFPDGEVIKRDLKYLEDLYGYTEEKDIQGQIDLTNNVNAATTSQEKKEIIRDYLKRDGVSSTLMDIRLKDIVFIIDQLEEMNQSDSFMKSKLDLDNIGTIGWSFGGAASFEVGSIENRVKACVNLDGWPYGPHFIDAEPMTVPFLYLVSDFPDIPDFETHKVIIEMLKDEAKADYMIKSIEGTSHINYSDFATYYAVTRFIKAAGELAGDEMKDVYREYVIPFLDSNLK